MYEEQWSYDITPEAAVAGRVVDLPYTREEVNLLAYL